MTSWSPDGQDRSMKRTCIRFSTVRTVWVAGETIQMQVFPGASRIPWPRHYIDPEGVHPTQERVNGILAAAEPRNKKELKSFLGLMTYNVKFLPTLADVLHPLYALLKKDRRWSWGKQHESLQESEEVGLQSTSVNSL